MGGGSYGIQQAVMGILLIESDTSHRKFVRMGHSGASAYPLNLNQIVQWFDGVYSIFAPRLLP